MLRPVLVSTVGLGVLALLLRRSGPGGSDRRCTLRRGRRAKQRPATVPEEPERRSTESPQKKADATAPLPTNAAQTLSASWTAQAAQAATDAMAARQVKPEGGATAAPLASEWGDGAPDFAEREFLVDNRQLQALTPGLGYRRSKSSADRLQDAWEPWGNVVKGIDEGEWLRVGKLFLPKRLGGITVLLVKESNGQAAPAAAAPQRVENLSSWPTCSDLDAETRSGSSLRSHGDVNGHETPRKIEVSELSTQSATFASTCPSHGWQYLDPKGNVQGPFSLPDMQNWNNKGYFRADLLMRCHPKDSFVPLAALFPAPLVPFQSHPRRPRRPRASSPR
ncbi:unnamed protein product [Effrenium voratum]|uniref:GYF domain-containing protein n=1 Tax=Effrenium voratum TaxID=2562239 RepID=A0AA36N436_9DINO|nr:unnamed protein product [Effrenium voratum]